MRLRCLLYSAAFQTPGHHDAGLQTQPPALHHQLEAQALQNAAAAAAVAVFVFVVVVVVVVVVVNAAFVDPAAVGFSHHGHDAKADLAQFLQAAARPAAHPAAQDDDAAAAAADDIPPHAAASTPAAAEAAAG